MGVLDCDVLDDRSDPTRTVEIRKTSRTGILAVSPILSSMCLADDLVDDPNFKAKCVMCHGAAAEGRKKMKTPPMKEKANKSAAELTKAIEEGNDKQTPNMLPFEEKLTPEQIQALVAEIKALK